MLWTRLTDLGVVNVLLGTVAAQTISGNLELLCAVSEAQEAQHPEQNADGFSRHHLDGAHIDSLGVITQPAQSVPNNDIAASYARTSCQSRPS